MLTCYKCGSNKLLQTPTMSKPIEHNGNKLIFTVCSNCWEINEFVNGILSRILLLPLPMNIKCDHIWKKWDEDGIEYCEKCNYERSYIEYLQGRGGGCPDCNGTGMTKEGLLYNCSDIKCHCQLEELPF